MSLKKEGYRERLIDKKIKEYLEVFGAVSIVGPKWCGKTWTSLNHAKSVAYLTDKNTKKFALADPKYIFSKEYPQLIDEWQIVPSIWDSVRHVCDNDEKAGKFILTGSTSLSKEEREEEVFHSGAGRIANIRMYPMSLYESGDSTGDISITGMYEGKIKEGYIKDVDLYKISELIVRGGWPRNLKVDSKKIEMIPKGYIDSIINVDINERKDKKRDPKKMRMLLRSLARNETTLASINTIIKDIVEFEKGDDLLTSRTTVSEYLGVLESLYLINDQRAFSIVYRSGARVGKVSKRHLVDPSLACALLDLNQDKLMSNFETLGLMFEALVERDLKIYMDYLGGDIFHFRDNATGDEVDAILEFENGDYAAVEIKLTGRGIEDATKSLTTFYNNVKKKPKFMCIILGQGSTAIKDKDTGIYIVPITALKP